MELNKVIEQLIPLGIVEFVIDGKSSYPRTYMRDTSGKIQIDGNVYYLTRNDIQIVSVDMSKIGDLMESLNFLMSQKGDNGVVDLMEIQSKSILKELDDMSNDIERLKYIQKVFIGDNTLLKSLSSSSNIKTGKNLKPHIPSIMDFGLRSEDEMEEMEDSEMEEEKEEVSLDSSELMDYMKEYVDKINRGETGYYDTYKY